ncbi:MAG: hypothetical protein JW870_13420 [Candidatus Delongbacteria bacterium]|nr:hypothetical protein [Candidatus Delongbacteria bacterium]
MKILDYLNQNSGAFIVVFTFFVTLSTIVYAILTAYLVKETKKMREVQTEPRIEMAIEPLEEAINIIRLRIKNIGLGPAINVKFKADVLSGGEGAQKLLSEFTDVNFLKTGLQYLGPNQKLYSKYTQMTENFEQKIKSLFQFEIIYESVTGGKYVEKAIIDISEMKGMSQIGRPNLYSIAKSLEKIQTDFGYILSGFKKIHTDIYTSSDREEYNKLLKKRYGEIEENEKDGNV